MWFRRRLHVHDSVRASVVWVRASCPPLNAAAIQIENRFITPRWIARFRSVEVPIGPVSTRPGRNIDAGAASQDLTHRVTDRSSIQIGIRLSYEAPIQFGAKRHRPTIRIRD